MNAHAIEVALDQDRGLTAPGRGTLQVGKLQRFPETDGKFVLGRPAIQRTTGIGDQLAALIADGDHDAPAQQTRSGIQAHAKLHGGRSIDSALRQIGV